MHTLGIEMILRIYLLLTKFCMKSSHDFLNRERGETVGGTWFVRICYTYGWDVYVCMCVCMVHSPLFRIYHKRWCVRNGFYICDSEEVTHHTWYRALSLVVGLRWAPEMREHKLSSGMKDGDYVCVCWMFELRDTLTNFRNLCCFSHIHHLV